MNDDGESAAAFAFGLLDAQRHVLDKMLTYVFPEGAVLLNEEAQCRLFGHMLTLSEEMLFLYVRWPSKPWLQQKTPDGG
jgi:hypothetical protein